MARYVKRGDVWQYEISTKDTTGKYKKIRKSGFTSKRLAMIAAAEIELKLSNGFKIGADDMLLSEYFENWITIYKKDKFSNNTFLRYQNTVYNLHKYFPNETLKSLTRTRYQIILNKFAETHATASVKQFNNHIRASVTAAIDEKVIVTDFTKKAVIVGQAPSRPENEKFLNLNDFKRLMATSSDQISPQNVTRLMVYLAGKTGMRFGELLGLTWDFVKFDKGFIEVTRTWNYVISSFAPTKNPQSHRKIAIDKKTLTVLLKFKRDQEKLFRKMDVENPEKFIFYNPKSGLVSNNAALHTLRRLQTQLSISPMIGMHGLRHTHASLLLLSDINILAVSKRLGHKDVTVTLTTYAHVLKELEDLQTEKVVQELQKI